MSTFMSYSRLGTLVGGFRPLSIRRRQGAWERVSDDQANTPAWLDDTRLIWQQDAYRSDGRAAFLGTSDGRTYARKASVLAAGAGRWVAQYEQAPPGRSAKAVVLYDGLERTIYGDPRPDHPSGYWGAGQHSVGYDGTLAYTPRFHEGRGVIIEAVDGQVLTRADDIPVTTTSAIDCGAVVVFSAQDAGHVWSWDGVEWARYKLAWPAYGGTAFRRHDGVYVAYSSGAMERTIVHRVDDASRGWLLGRPGKCYNACGWTDPASGETWIAWSENAGASLDAIREERLNDEAQAWPAPSSAPLRLPASMPAIWIGMDAWNPVTRTTRRLPGSFQWSGVAGDTRPAYDGVPWLRSYSSFFALAGVIADEPNREFATKADELVALERELRRRDKGTVAVSYSDRAGQTYSNAAADHRDALRVAGFVALIGLRCYPTADETADQTVQRIADFVLDNSAWQFDFCVAAYRGNGAWSEDHVRRVAEGIVELARAKPKAVRILRFFGVDRPDGMPEFVPYVEALTRLAGTPKPIVASIKPTPTPPTPPPSAPSFVDRAREIVMSTTRRVTLQLAGKYVGADPNASDESAYADRDAAQGWEVILLTRLDDGRYVAQFEAAHKTLSATNRQTTETRPWDARGGWEIGRAAEIPPDWPKKLIYDNGLAYDIAYLD